MTYLQYVESIAPECVGKKFKGGGFLCPYRYISYLPQHCISKDYNCTECWNTEIPNDLQEKLKEGLTNDDIRALRSILH